MEVKIEKVFLIFLVFQLNFAKTQAEDIPPNVDCLDIWLHSNCQLNMTEESTQQINGNFSSTSIRFVRLNPIVRPYYSDEFWRVKNRSDEIGKYFWVWADKDIGQQFLSLGYSFVEMSLWTLSIGVEKINIDLYEVQQGCWVTLNVTEQFCTLASLFLNRVYKSAVTNRHLQDSLICYNKPNSSMSLDLWPSIYKCSIVSNDFNIQFSFETERIASNVYFFLIGLYIVYFLSPIIIAWALPKRFKIRYFQTGMQEMRKIELQGPETTTPLDELFTFSLENRASVFGALFLIYPLAHAPFIFIAYVDTKYYRDMPIVHFLAQNILICSTLVFILTLFRVWIKTKKKFEDWRAISELIERYMYTHFWILHYICPCEWEPPCMDFGSCNVMDEYIYISYDKIAKNILLQTMHLMKCIAFHVNLMLHKFNCKTLFMTLLCIFFGLPISVFIIPFFAVFLFPFYTFIDYTYKCLALYVGYIHTFVCALYASWFVLLSIYYLVIATAFITAGAFINYEIVLPYVVLGLSLIYYIWHPFHVLQEKYRVLKTIVFKECSSSGPKLIKSVRVNGNTTVKTKLLTCQDCEDSDEETDDARNVQTTDSSNNRSPNGLHSHRPTVPHRKNRIAPLECGDAPSSNTAFDNALNLQTTDSSHTRSPNGPHSHRPTVPHSKIRIAPLECGDAPSSSTASDNALNLQTTDSSHTRSQTPSLEQDKQQYVLLYKSDSRGWERIPKDLWESIYKKLLPLDEGIAKACITSIVAIFMAIFLMLTMVGFRNASELQLSGQAFASFISVSIPRFVLGFIDTDGSKEARKRSWEVAVRDIVKQYIKDNEIPDPRNID